MTGAKSAFEVNDDMTFLDLTVLQIEHLNATSRVDVPLILMTSFNTHDDTLRIIKKYANQQPHITTFNQSRYPCIFKETLLPCPKRADDDKKSYPVHKYQSREGHPFLVRQGSDRRIHLEVLPWPLQFLLANDFYNKGIAASDRVERPL